MVPPPRSFERLGYPRHRRANRPSAVHGEAGHLGQDGPDVTGALQDAALPDGAGAVEGRPAEVELRLARGRENTAQPRDLGRSLAAIQAWQAEALRRAVRLNREGDLRGAVHFLGREARWMERYARGVPGAEPLLAELVLRRAGEEWDERTRKAVYAASAQRSRHEPDLRAAAQPTIAERFGGGGRTGGGRPRP